MEEEEIFSHSLVVTCFSVLPLPFYPQIAHQHQPSRIFLQCCFCQTYVLMQSGCNGRRRRRKNSSLCPYSMHPSPRLQLSLRPTRPHATEFSFPTNTTTRNRRSHKFKKTRKEGKSEIWVREGGEEEEEEEEQPRLIPCYDPWRREENFLSARRAREEGEKNMVSHIKQVSRFRFSCSSLCVRN